MADQLPTEDTPPVTRIDDVPGRSVERYIFLIGRGIRVAGGLPLAYFQFLYILRIDVSNLEVRRMLTRFNTFERYNFTRTTLSQHQIREYVRKNVKWNDILTSSIEDEVWAIFKLYAQIRRSFSPDFFPISPSMYFLFDH